MQAAKSTARRSQQPRPSTGGRSTPGVKSGIPFEGTLRVHARGFGFVDAETESWYCGRETLPGLLDGDIVSGVGVGDRAASLALVRRVRTEVIGTVMTRAGGLILELDEHIGTGELPLSGKARDGQTVIARLGRKGASITETLEGFEASMRARALVRQQLPRTMPETVTIPELGRLRPGQRRRDLRDLVTLTIDDQSSMDLDDALSIIPADTDGCIRLLVHISDVAEHVTVGSPADVAARAVGTSIYLHPWVRPMLPASLSEDRLSLVPGVDRDTLTVELRIDAEGEVRSVDVYESRINSNGRIDYQLASKVLREEEVGVDPLLRETLRWLRTVSARLSVARDRRGGLAARYVEPELRGQAEARDLIERCMVAANEAVAGWMTARGLAGLWRVHDAPDAEAVAELDELVTRLGFYGGLGATLTPRALAGLDKQLAGADTATQGLWHATLERMGRARYQAMPGGHFGLGSESYCHFTSPIRRYADLAVHRAVKAHLAGAERTLDLTALALHLNEQSGRASRAESQLRVAHRVSTLAEQGRTITGTVTGVREHALRVWLDVGVRAHLPLKAMKGRWNREGVCLVGPGGKSLCPGQSIKLKITKLDVVNGIVEVAQV